MRSSGEFVIYDYMNHPSDIFFHKPIKKITVKVVSGDEVISVVFDDGDFDFMDSSDDRLENILDGEYTLDDPEKIEQWMDFVPDEQKYKIHHVGYSYQRMEMIAGEEKEDSNDYSQVR